MVGWCIVFRFGLILAGMLAACAGPGAAWRAHERGLPPECGDAAALWGRLTADATDDERNGDLTGLHARTLDAWYRHQPIVHLRVDDGWLVGVDNGEWGGVLWWVATGGAEHRRLATANVRALVATDGEVVAVTGLSHQAAGRPSQPRPGSCRWNMAVYPEKVYDPDRRYEWLESFVLTGAGDVAARPRS